MSGKKVFLKFFQGNQPKGASSRRVVGERGSNDLPPGKKGGETMTPDRHYEHKQHAFDSFCKKVLKCEAYNGYREISRRQSREVTFSELPEIRWSILRPMTGIPGNTLPSLLGRCDPD